MDAVTKNGTSALARPYSALRPLIREELRSGDAAAQNAGMPYYKRAGEMLHEAKADFPTDRAGERAFWSKAQKDFSRDRRQLQRYMDLADTYVERAPKSHVSLRQALSETGPGRTGKVSWQAPVQQVMGTVNFDRMNQERKDREREAQLVRQLALKIVEIGYRALAAKMHPDVQGGSKEAFQRLGEAKNLLKGAV